MSKSKSAVKQGLHLLISELKCSIGYIYGVGEGGGGWGLSGWCYVGMFRLSWYVLKF